MGIWILFSSVAVVVAIVGCATIWRFDRLRAEEISHDRTRLEPRQPHRLPAPSLRSDQVEE